MNVIESLRPQKRQRVMDLVASAGMDVAHWKISNKGEVKVPASNPAYCYEWAFEDPFLVVLNVWHDQLKEANGKIWCDLNLKAWSDEGKRSKALLPSERGALSKRASRMDKVIATAYTEQLPVRLIIGTGSQRDISIPRSGASRMTLRLLDPEQWSVARYNSQTGKCHLVRGVIPKYVDQFELAKRNPPDKIEVVATVWVRNPRIREIALARARGHCEYCNQPGFKMADGKIYLETHHVVPLSELGFDHESNVVALCPNHHREAHHGKLREAIRKHLLEKLAAIYMQDK